MSVPQEGNVSSNLFWTRGPDDDTDERKPQKARTEEGSKKFYFSVGVDDDEDDDILSVEQTNENIEILTHSDRDDHKGSPSPPVPSLLYRNSVTKDTFLRGHMEYSSHFMDFGALRAILDKIALHQPNASADFLQRLDAEWNVYQRFVEDEVANINELPVQKYVLIDVLKFNQFVCINQRSLQGMIREYDALSLSGNLCAIWDWKMNWKPQKMVFPLIREISDLYRQESATPQTGQSPSNKIDEFSFDRHSVKYFVKRSNLVQVIGVIIQHLPIFVFGEKDDSKKLPSQSKISGHVSSVYFDDDDFKCYHERVGKVEGARVFRIRWYGDKEPSDPKCTVFMERKIHHQGWLNSGPSLKERFKLNSGKVPGFLDGSLQIPEDQQSKKRTQLQHEIYEFVREFKMKPKTRTVCDRISFQLPHNNDLRISLDLNLKFVKERSDLLHADWFTPHDQLRADDVVDFAFDVLEIKLAGACADNPPQWIQDLMDSALLCECWKFSKYGQSVHQFFADQLSIVPKWIENVDVLQIASRREEEEVVKPAKDVRIAVNAAAPAEKKAWLADDNLFKLLLGDCVCRCPKEAAGGRKSKRKPVNPKVHFSSERTFLQWFKAAIFIGSSGLSVNALAPEQPAGLMMVGVAGIIVAWAMVVYYIRIWKLLSGRMEGLHDLLGPGFLGALLLFLFVYASYDETIRSGFEGH